MSLVLLAIIAAIQSPTQPEAPPIWLLVRDRDSPSVQYTSDFMNKAMKGEDIGPDLKTAGYFLAPHKRFVFAFSKETWRAEAIEKSLGFLDAAAAQPITGASLRLATTTSSYPAAAFLAQGWTCAKNGSIGLRVRWRVSLKDGDFEVPLTIEDPRPQLDDVALSSMKPDGAPLAAITVKLPSEYYFTTVDSHPPYAPGRYKIEEVDAEQHAAIDQLENHFLAYEAVRAAKTLLVVKRLGQTAMSSAAGHQLAELPEKLRSRIAEALSAEWSDLGFASEADARQFSAGATVISTAPQLIFDALAPGGKTVEAAGP